MKHPNVERLVFRNFQVANIEIKKIELLQFFNNFFNNVPKNHVDNTNLEWVNPRYEKTKGLGYKNRQKKLKLIMNSFFPWKTLISGIKTNLDLLYLQPILFKAHPSFRLSGYCFNELILNSLNIRNSKLEGLNCEMLEFSLIECSAPWHFCPFSIVNFSISQLTIVNFSIPKFPISRFLIPLFSIS